MVFSKIISLYFPAHRLKPEKKPKKISTLIRKNWLNILAVCATVLGLSTTIYFIFYTEKSDNAPPPIVFGRNYDSDTCKSLQIAIYNRIACLRASHACSNFHSHSEPIHFSVLKFPTMSYQHSKIDKWPIFYSSQPEWTLHNWSGEVGRNEPFIALSHWKITTFGEIRRRWSHGGSNATMFQHLHLLGEDAIRSGQRHREQRFVWRQRKFLCEFSKFCSRNMNVLKP